MHFRTKQAGIKPFAMQKVRWSVQQIDARDCVASMLCGSLEEIVEFWRILRRNAG
jgi:hypothetical protein